MSENKSQHVAMLKTIVLLAHFGCILHMKTLFPFSEQGGFSSSAVLLCSFVDLNGSQEVRNLMKQLSFNIEYFLYLCIYFLCMQQVIKIYIPSTIIHLFRQERNWICSF